MKIKTMNKLLLFFISITCCCCSNDILYSDYKDFSEGWKSTDSVTFHFKEIPNSKGNIFINLRNDNNYLYSNIFLITSLVKDGVEIRKDTLEYSMTDKTGNFLGNGFGSVKESLLYWREDYSFSSVSNYSVVLNHAMRKNGNQFGMKVLPGITSIGISITLNK